MFIKITKTGIPDALCWIEEAVTEIISNYNIDVIHFDDYFYHISEDSLLNGANFQNKADWHRNNTHIIIMSYH